MGASSSFNESINLCDIYFSYTDEYELLTSLINNLIYLDYNIQNSCIIKESLKTNSISQISSYVKQFLTKTNYIFICISSKTITSICQSIEINEIYKQPEINTKIIYIMTEADFTPLTNKELYKIINKNIWLPLYDEESFKKTNEFIITLLKH